MSGALAAGAEADEVLDPTDIADNSDLIFAQLTTGTNLTDF